MNISCSTKIRTEIVDAVSGKVVRRSPWQKNLILDQGLNNFAAKGSVGTASPVYAFQYCHVGSGTYAQQIASGAITFTQAGTNAVVASGNFFTAAMVGGILKYGAGTAGVEQYITSFSDGQHAGLSGTVTIVASVGTVWQVQQTTLYTSLYITNAYRTLSNDNGTVAVNSTGVLTHQRTFQFPVQGVQYTVNEIGYSTAGSSTGLNGRILLTSGDVVGTSQYYVVVIQVTVTYSPLAPTAVTNVGTNLNTAGNLMLECLDASSGTASFSYVTSTGTIYQGSLDTGTGTGSYPFLLFATATYNQNSSPQSAGVVITNVHASRTTAWTWQSTGLCTAVWTTISIATTGQSCYGMGLATDTITTTAVDIKFTTPQTLPTGSFVFSATWQLLYTRVLSN